MIGSVVAAPNTLWAQAEIEETASGMILEELIVTARKRDEPVQDVPITINAYSGESLRLKGINDIELVEENTPGFTLEMVSI